MVVLFVDYGGIVNHHCLNFLFIKCLPQVSGFLRFPPPIKLTATI